MENTINRKDYRRNSYETYESVKKEEVQNVEKKHIIMNQIINSLLLLLFVLLLKFFEFDREFEFIKENFLEGIPYETLEKNVKEKLNTFFKMDFKESYNLLIESGDFLKEENINIDIIENEKNTEMSESGDVKQEYISAVDGVNTLLEDSQIIKEKYEIMAPLKGIITSKFGIRESDNPIVSSYHAGLDIAANTGTNIASAHDGIVIQAGDNGTYGKSIIIESGDLKTIYAHCSSVLVKKGDSIEKGDVIGKVGMTGNATGPHLHFEVRFNERLVNPEDVI